MQSLKDFHKEDISYDSIQTLKDEYVGHDCDYYKVKLKNTNDLLNLLDHIPRKV